MIIRPVLLLSPVESTEYCGAGGRAIFNLNAQMVKTLVAADSAFDFIEALGMHLGHLGKLLGHVGCWGDILVGQRSNPTGEHKQTT